MPDSPHTAPVQDDDAFSKRVSLEVARFRPFDGESYDEFALRLMAMIRAHDASRLSPTPDTGLIEALERHLQNMIALIEANTMPLSKDEYREVVAARAALANATQHKGYKQLG